MSTTEKTSQAKLPLDIFDLDVIADILKDTEDDLRKDAKVEGFGIEQGEYKATADMIQELRDRVYCTRETMKKEAETKAQNLAALKLAFRCMDGAGMYARRGESREALRTVEIAILKAEGRA